MEMYLAEYGPFESGFFCSVGLIGKILTLNFSMCHASSSERFLSLLERAIW